MAISRLAKLSPPRASDWVRRARLHRLLDAATRRAVAWIAAEPGAGKSTLAAAWATERAGRARRQRIGHDDWGEVFEECGRVHA